MDIYRERGEGRAISWKARGLIYRLNCLFLDVNQSHHMCASDKINLAWNFDTCGTNIISVGQVPWTHICIKYLSILHRGTVISISKHVSQSYHFIIACANPSSFGLVCVYGLHPAHQRLGGDMWHGRWRGV